MSLEELCAMVNVPYDEARLLQPVIDSSETDEEEHEDEDDVSVAEDLLTGS